MMDRNNALIPDGWSLETEEALTTGLCLEGCYSEHPGVCRKVELENDFDHWQVRPTDMTGHTDRHGSSGKSTWQLGCTCQTGQHDRSGRHTAGQACMTSHRSTWQVRHVTQIWYNRSGRSTWQARHIKQTWQVRQKNTTGQTAQHDRSDMSNRHDRSETTQQVRHVKQTWQDRSDKTIWQVRQTNMTGQADRQDRLTYNRSDQQTWQNRPTKMSSEIPVRHEGWTERDNSSHLHSIFQAVGLGKAGQQEQSSGAEKESDQTTVGMERENRQAARQWPNILDTTGREVVQRKSLTKQQRGWREKTDKQPDSDPTFWTPRAGKWCRERVWPNNSGDGERKQTSSQTVTQHFGHHGQGSGAEKESDQTTVGMERENRQAARQWPNILDTTGREAVQRKSLTKQQWGWREKTDTEADKQPDTDPTFWTSRAGQRCRERVWPNNSGDRKRKQTHTEAGKQRDTDPTFWTPRAGRSSAPAGRCSSWWFWPWTCPHAWAAVDTSTADQRNPPRLCIWDIWCMVKDNACTVVTTKFFPTLDTKTANRNSSTKSRQVSYISFFTV